MPAYTSAPAADPTIPDARIRVQLTPADVLVMKATSLQAMADLERQRDAWRDRCLGIGSFFAVLVVFLGYVVFLLWRR